MLFTYSNVVIHKLWLWASFQIVYIKSFKIGIGKVKVIWSLHHLLGVGLVIKFFLNYNLVFKWLIIKEFILLVILHYIDFNICKYIHNLITLNALTFKKHNYRNLIYGKNNYDYLFQQSI